MTSHIHVAASGGRVELSHADGLLVLTWLDAIGTALSLSEMAIRAAVNLGLDEEQICERIARHAAARRADGR